MDQTDYFKQSFKYFKQKRKSEIINSVINIEENATLLKFADENRVDKCAICESLGLKSHQKWHVYQFKELNGFFYIRNPFNADSQLYWIRKCLKDYTQKPSITNLDLHHSNLDDIWSLYRDGKSSYIDKLSWATLGYHYDWDKKIYHRAKFSIFPKCLSNLVKHIALCLGFHTFDPDAAIVNYYNTKSTLGIHNDHSEEELSEPIVSVSFGLSAVFLLGTERRDEKPLSIVLRSGDIVILSGKSRLAYHAVPAVIANDDIWNCDEKPLSDYIRYHRINISVRQVYSK